MPHLGHSSAYDGCKRDRWPGSRPLTEELEEMTREPSGTGAARARLGYPRRRTPLRAFALVALVVVAVAVFAIARGDDSREYRVMMENAGQLVPGDLVRIGG